MTRVPGGGGARTERRLRAAGLVALAVVALAIPFFFGSFRVGQFTQAIALAVAVLGLNLLVGYSGQISLGHGAFFALGSYVSAILIVRADVPYLLTLPVAGAACFAAGLLFGLPALRLRGLYLALVTLGLAIATPQLIKRFDGLTGGTQGLSVPRPAAPAWSGLADDQFLYLLTLAAAVVMFALAVGLVRGSVGRALIVVRDNEIAAKTMGVNLATVKTRAFAVSSMYAGVGGALYMLPIGFVAPESFPLALSFGFLAAIVVGGLATIGGAVFGALFIEFVPVYASDVDEALAGVIYGTVLIAFMYLLPGGVMGLARRLWARWPAAGAAEPEPDSADRRPQPRAGARSEDVVQGIPGGSSR
jgi:branched-chain amino acid transport system permease protein